MVKYRNIFIYPHSPYSQVITIKNPDQTVDDVTGYTGRMYLAKHHESATKYAVDLIIENAAGGMMKASLAPESTAILPVGTMMYSVFVTPPGDEERLIMQGAAVIEPTIHPALP
jgi:hypothetical protein